MALAFSLSTAGILFLLRDVFEVPAITLLYLVPVGLSAAFWGLWPGIIAALAAFLSLNYFFTEPYYTLFVHHPQDLLKLVVFLGVAVGISQLVGRLRDSLAIAMAREKETTQLYELSTELTRLHNEDDILRSIAQFIQEAFQVDRVEIVCERSSGSSPPCFVEAGEKIKAEPSEVFAMQSPHRLEGEIRIWRGDYPLSIAENRLMQAFISQGVLALGRARLVEADTRARILEESDRFKSSLLSSVSHELRTPLSTIKASVSSLRSGAVEWDTGARQELLEAIEEETDHLNQLVGNLLNMTRIEAGALKPERQWNAVEEIIASALKHTRMMTRSHKMVVDITEDLPLIFVDEILIEQVLINLIHNSTKNAPENTEIRLEARLKDGNEIWVQVSNQGPPVSESDLERIFGKFYRPSADRRVTGSGLGLSICKGMVEAHGGKIWAENLPGGENSPGGFAIIFTLPVTGAGIPILGTSV